MEAKKNIYPRYCKAFSNGEGYRKRRCVGSEALLPSSVGAGNACGPALLERLSVDWLGSTIKIVMMLTDGSIGHYYNRMCVVY